MQEDPVDKEQGLSPRVRGNPSTRYLFVLYGGLSRVCGGTSPAPRPNR